MQQVKAAEASFRASVQQVAIAEARAAQQAAASEPGASALGTRQLARVEAVLAEEARLLAQARAKVQRLQQAMYARS